jgi:hypothetical protein
MYINLWHLLINRTSFLTNWMRGSILKEHIKDRGATTLQPGQAAPFKMHVSPSDVSINEVDHVK